MFIAPNAYRDYELRSEEQNSTKLHHSETIPLLPNGAGGNFLLYL